MEAYLKRAVITGLFSGSRSLDVSFEQGVNCIHGVNGSGKTVFINLLMGALGCQKEYLGKVRFQSIDIYIQKSGNQRASKLFSVIAHGEKVVKYVFHQKMTPSLIHRVSGGLSGYRFTGHEPVKKGDIIAIDLSDDDMFDIDVERIRSLINSTFATTYVPLLRGVNSRVNRFYEDNDDNDPYVAMLDHLQETFSRRYGSALSIVNKGLEKLKSKIFEKLMFDDTTDSSVSSEINAVSEIIRTGKVIEVSAMDEALLLEDIKNSDLPISTAQLERHFEIWAGIQNRVIKANHEYLRLEEEFGEKSGEVIKSRNEYTEAYFKCLSSVKFYKRFSEAVDEIRSVQKDKNKELAPFRKFVEQMNEFLSLGKTFSLTASGAFQVRFDGEYLRFEDLSSGEKHILAILARVCLSAFSKSTLFVADEPELSLHLEWQRMIIPSIKTVSPNMQVVVATHSPSVIPDDANMINILECYGYE
ncbi:MAG: AAA family ATPase [Colwellia sp.]|nr:AAA family ATPase [Colwellia sp.]